MKHVSLKVNFGKHWKLDIRNICQAPKTISPEWQLLIQGPFTCIHHPFRSPRIVEKTASWVRERVFSNMHFVGANENNLAKENHLVCTRCNTFKKGVLLESCNFPLRTAVPNAGLVLLSLSSQVHTAAPSWDVILLLLRCPKGHWTQWP